MKTHRILACMLCFSMLAAAAFGQSKSGWKARPFKDLGESRAQVALFSKDGKILACAYGNEVTFWDTASGKLRGIVSLPATRKTPACLSFSSDGKLLAVTSALANGKNAYVDIVDVEDACKERSNLDGKPKIVTLENYLMGFFAPDGKRLHLAATPKGRFLLVTFHYWDRASGKVVPTKLTASNIIATRGMAPAQGIRNVWQPRQDTFAINDAGNATVVVNAANTNWFDLSRSNDPLAATLFNSVGGFPGAHEMAEGEAFCFAGFVPGSDVCLLGSLGGKIYCAGKLTSDWIVRAKDLKSHAPARGRRRNGILYLAVTPDRKTMLALSEDGKLTSRAIGDVLKKMEAGIKPNKNGAIRVSDAEMNLPLPPTAAVRIARAPVYASMSRDCRQIVIMELDKKRVPRPKIFARE